MLPRPAVPTRSPHGLGRNPGRRMAVLPVTGFPAPAHVFARGEMRRAEMLKKSKNQL
jgi:hypothetical protein